MNGIRLRLLGGFQVEADGADQTGVLMRTPKGVLLMQYLILNRGRMETTAALTRAIWQESESTRPESALKTLISRLRTILSQLSPALGACLKTVRGGYQWETQAGVTVDVEEFLKLAEKLHGAVDVEDRNQNRDMQRMMEIYTGRLLCEQEQPEWMKKRADALHQLYLDVVEETLQKLQNASRLQDVVSLCRQALDADPLNEGLNVRLMDALMHTEREGEAVRRYQYASEMNQSSNGGALDEYYSRMLRTERDLQQTLDELRMELVRGMDKPGALICDRVVFTELFRLEQRSLERQQGTITLGVVRLSGLESSPWQQDAAMTCLMDVMVHRLRRGDVLTRLNATQVALLLPHLTQENVGVVADRIKRSFYLQYPTGCTLSCVFSPIDVGTQRKEDA